MRECVLVCVGVRVFVWACFKFAFVRVCELCECVTGAGLHRPRKTIAEGHGPQHSVEETSYAKRALFVNGVVGHVAESSHGASSLTVAELVC